jgi:uncharacterized membrane protein
MEHLVFIVIIAKWAATVIIFVVEEILYQYLQQRNQNRVAKFFKTKHFNYAIVNY